MSNKELSLPQKIIPGVIALFILLFYYVAKLQISEFYTWLIQTIIIYAASFFFIRIIITTAMDREYNKNFTIPALIGVAALFTSVFFLNVTPEEVLKDFLISMVIWSLFATVYGVVQDKVSQWK
jgi:hypothetical protein